MFAFLSVLRRCWLVPHLLPLCLLVALVAGLAHWLGVRALGAGSVSQAELRQGVMLMAALLHLGLCAPLVLRDEARSGLILLRRARGLSAGLLLRAAALLVSTLPVCVLVMLASRGLPADPFGLLVSIAAWVALGLLLGSLLSGAPLRAALWTLGALSLLRGVLLSDDVARGLAWLLPPLPGPGVPLLAGALWTAGALLLAEWRLRRVTL